MTFFFNQKILQYFNDFHNGNFSVLPLKWGLNDRNETNSHIFLWDIYLTSFFLGRKTLNNFNDFYNWHFSIPLPNWAQTNKMKENLTGQVQIWQYFFRIYELLRYFNDICISWWGLSQKWIITGPEEKSPPYNFIP